MNEHNVQFGYEEYQVAILNNKYATNIVQIHALHSF